MDKSDISAVILAGGRGARMGGADKGLLPLGGKPMIAHVIERLAPQVGTLLICANRNLEAYRQFGLPVISDHFADYCGPLAGLHSALSTISTDWLISAPCDTPFLPPIMPHACVTPLTTTLPVSRMMAPTCNRASASCTVSCCRSW